MNRLCALVLPLIALGIFAGEQKTPPQPRPDPNPPTVADESYGPHEANKFDLWLPKSEKPTPLLMNVHGGGFMAGTKKEISMSLRELCLKNGIAYASIEYRFSQVAKYPAQMHDCARALQYIRQNAGKWNLDPKHVASTGGSAGAGISMWLAFHDDMADPKSADPIARQSTRISCALPTAGQCTYDPREIKKIVPGEAYKHPALRQLHGLKRDFDWDKDAIDSALEAMLKDCSALPHLTKDDAPVFQMHFSRQENVGDIHHPNFGRHLEAEMKKLGIECISRLDSDFKQGMGGYNDEALAFLKKHFGM